MHVCAGYAIVLCEPGFCMQQQYAVCSMSWWFVRCRRWWWNWIGQARAARGGGVEWRWAVNPWSGKRGRHGCGVIRRGAGGRGRCMYMLLEELSSRGRIGEGWMW